MDSPRRPPDFGEPAPAEAAWDSLPEALDVARTAGHQALLDQGLRLNRAFIRIKDPLVRAIVNLVTDAARTQSGEAVFRAAGRTPKTGAR